MDATTPIIATSLTQHGLSELLSLPERTLEDWRLTRTGPPYLQLGRHVLYDVQDVPAWLQEPTCNGFGGGGATDECRGRPGRSTRGSLTWPGRG
jgi:hypothetical protein